MYAWCSVKVLIATWKTLSVANGAAPRVLTNLLEIVGNKKLLQ